MLKLTSAFGVVVLVALAWLLSENKRLFPWRTVIWGVALQLGVGLFVLDTRMGMRFFNGCQLAVERLIGFADEGNRLVFGPLARPDVLGAAFGPQNAFLLVITITGTIILVAAVSALLYHYGILQLIVRGMAWAMRRVMGTSGSETLAAAANIFMGQTEAPLLIKPYVPRMTRSARDSSTNSLRRSSRATRLADECRQTRAGREPTRDAASSRAVVDSHMHCAVRADRREPRHWRSAIGTSGGSSGTRGRRRRGGGHDRARPAFAACCPSADGRLRPWRQRRRVAGGAAQSARGALPARSLGWRRGWCCARVDVWCRPPGATPQA